MNFFPPCLVVSLFSYFLPHCPLPPHPLLAEGQTPRWALGVTGDSAGLVLTLFSSASGGEDIRALETLA